MTVDDYFAPPSSAWNGIDAVVNFAGLTQGRDESALQRINTDGPLALGAASREHGVKQFVQLSSLHVYGYCEYIDHGTLEGPVSAYGRSKLAADAGLRELCSERFAVTILRLPVLYGGGSGANLKRLAVLMRTLRFFPVPFPAPLRSTLHVDNLAQAIDAVLTGRMRGVQFAADDTPMTLESFAAAIDLIDGGTPIRLLRLPAGAFLPLRVMSPGLYHRLYGQSLIRSGAVIVSTRPYQRRLNDDLKDIFKEGG